MDLVTIIFSILSSLIALTIHEYAHGFTAYKLGDDTAHAMGRLSLNPLHHLDPIGVICMVFFHVGWAKPVPINPANFKNPKKGFALTALAGPAVNLSLGFVTTLVYLTCLKLLPLSGDSFIAYFMLYTTLFLKYFLMINIGLGVFNLFPLPPFDGSRILNSVLPDKIYFKIMKYEKYIYYGVLGWLLLGDYIYRFLISISFIRSSTILSAIVYIFSLSGIINRSINGVINLFLNFWEFFIP